jgi:hypothetical protein
MLKPDTDDDLRGIKRVPTVYRLQMRAAETRQNAVKVAENHDPPLRSNFASSAVLLPTTQQTRTNTLLTVPPVDLPQLFQ